MAINSYEEDGKKYYEVYVNGSDSAGRRVQRRKRGIETLRKAETVEFELKRELAMLREAPVAYRFHEWFEICLKRMKVEYKPSTVYNNQTQIRKWVMPHWEQTEINQISHTDVHEMVFEKCSEIISPNNRKTILKMIKRLFEMAVEDGRLDRNPCVGVQVKAPEVEQKVLTNSEVEIFLREAKITGHRFYPIWAMALKWTDIDFDARTISVSKQWTSKNGLGPTKTQRSRIGKMAHRLT